MFSQITDKKEIKEIKELFLEGEYINTVSFENGTPFHQSVKFGKLRNLQFKDKQTFEKFHEIKSPKIDDVISALSLDKASFTNTTHRRYKLWAVKYIDKHILISHNKDRGIDVYYDPELFLEHDVYNMLYNYYKTIYESKGNTDFKQYYPAWNEL